MTGAFGSPMSRYEARYADYFRAFCNSPLASNRFNIDDTLSTLLPYLKRQLGILRRAILEHAEGTGLRRVQHCRLKRVRACQRGPSHQG